MDADAAGGAAASALSAELEKHLQNRIRTLKLLIRGADGRISAAGDFPRLPPPELCSRTAELLHAGRPLAAVAAETGLSFSEIALVILVSDFAETVPSASRPRGDGVTPDTGAGVDDAAANGAADERTG